MHSGRRERGPFFGFPNSYGSLGYALRLKIELEPVAPFIRLRHIRFDDVLDLAAAMAQVTGQRRFDGEAVDYMDATMFGRDEMYLTLGRYAHTGQPSDYTGQGIYYRSLREHRVDALTVHDYLWRWDTDWFWCSSAFGVQRSAVRRVWPTATSAAMCTEDHRRGSPLGILAKDRRPADGRPRRSWCRTWRCPSRHRGVHGFFERGWGSPRCGCACCASGDPARR